MRHEASMPAVSSVTVMEVRLAGFVVRMARRVRASARVFGISGLLVGVADVRRRAGGLGLGVRLRGCTLGGRVEGSERRLLGGGLGLRLLRQVAALLRRRLAERG